MERHLGPELDAIKSFEFSDVDTQVTMLGEHTALGRETYRYRIELTDGRAIDRRGVATSVLRHEPGAAWQIVRYHSSSRAVN
jgi:ketosteroid isomerase-like protein